MFTIPPSNYNNPDYTPAGPVMFRGKNATILADPGDEDNNLLHKDWLDLFAYVADNGNDLGDRLTRMLSSEIEVWRLERR